MFENSWVTNPFLQPITEGTEVKNVSRPGAKEKMYVVIDNGQEIGVLTKFPDTRTDISPWKAFEMPNNGNQKILGFFYDDSARSKIGDSQSGKEVHFGGKEAAIAAIKKAARPKLNEEYSISYGGKSTPIFASQIIAAANKVGLPNLAKKVEDLQRQGIKYSNQDFDVLSHVTSELYNRGIKYDDLLKFPKAK